MAHYIEWRANYGLQMGSSDKMEDRKSYQEVEITMLRHFAPTEQAAEAGLAPGFRGCFVPGEPGSHVHFPLTFRSLCFHFLFIIDSLLAGYQLPFTVRHQLPELMPYVEALHPPVLVSE